MYKAFYKYFWVCLILNLIQHQHVWGQQNLVLNPSFEEYWQCPSQTSSINECKYVFNPNCTPYGNINCIGTSDYFNKCAPSNNDASIPNNYFGFQTSKTGNGYIGLGDNKMIREYVQIKLSHKMSANTVYTFSFYANLSNYSHITTNQLGLKFVSDSVIFNQQLWKIMQPDWISNTNITDTTDWTLLSGDYKAKGGEQWLIVGNFYPDSVFPFIEVRNSVPPGWENGYYIYIDDFIVETPKFSAPNVFTPNNDKVNDWWLVNGEVVSVEIYNRWGEKVFFSNENFSGWDGRTISGIECSEGIYYYIISVKTEDITENYKGSVTLLR